MPSLFVIRGNDQGARWELDDPNLGIGRDSSNPIQLHDTEVSRRHAEVRRTEGKDYALIDLGSSNGTYVNNHRIRRYTLESGDEVRIGSTVMLYKGPDDDSAMDLTNKIDIVSKTKPGEDSVILKAVDTEQKSPYQVDGRAHKSNLEVMYRTALAVSHTLDIDQLLGRVLKLIFEWLDCDRGCIYLVNPDTRKLEPKAMRSREGLPEEKIVISKTIVDYVMKNGQGVLTSDAQDDERWDAGASLLKQNIHEAVCVPMQGRHNNMVGLIYIDTSISPQELVTDGKANKFNEQHLKLMVAIGHQAAMAVEDTRYYSELMQAERLAAIGETIATLSHHVKNILQGIQGGSYLIDMGLADHDKLSKEASDIPELQRAAEAASMIRKGWKMVEKNQAKISNLVLDMLTFSKEREPALEPANLNEVVADVIELMESRAEDLDVKVSCTLDDAMPVLTFDPEGIHRAILNVVTNAIDACYESKSDEKPDVEVKVATEYVRNQGIARVIIEDTGIGIPPEAIEKIFVVFTSSKKGGRGTGLGLSVSNKILHEHGGKILVESEVDQGSRFTLQLPAVFPESLKGGAKPKIDPRTTTAMPKEKEDSELTPPPAAQEESSDEVDEGPLF